MPPLPDAKSLLTENADLDEPLPEWLVSIRPNYAGVRKKYLLICLAAAIITCAFELIMLFVYLQDPEAYGGFKTPVSEYILMYNVIPSMLNFAAVIFAAIFVRYCKNEYLKNVAPILAFAMICTVIAAAHSSYSITLAVMALPIFMVAIYGQHSLNIATTLTCALGLSIALVFRTFNIYIVNDMALLPESLCAYVLLLIASYLSWVLIRLLNAQKKRLVDATRSAEEARKQAWEANQAKSTFLASTSHEVRTPLNAIIGMTEVIARKTTEPEVREYANDIMQAGNSLLAIIGDIIDISKIESGKIEIHEINYELGSLINDSYNMVAIRLRDKGLTARVICDESLPRMLCGDEYHLRQVIVNLLTNALKYTEDGEITLKASGEENGDILRLEIRVKDTGIGIREEDLPDLFNQFKRAGDARERKIEGAGLGLNIAKQLVELMGGTIEVTSVYGVGSTFVVCVPQKIVDRTPIGDIYATYLDYHGELAHYRRSFEAPDVRVLVVDDVQNNLQVICKLLEDTKMQVDTAASGRECVQMARRTRYDIILMDHMMPVMDGVETLHALRALDDCASSETPVVMLTANAMLDAREEYMNAGFVDYLSKPVRGARLESMLLRHIPADKVVMSAEDADCGVDGDVAGVGVDADGVDAADGGASAVAGAAVGGAGEAAGADWADVAIDTDGSANEAPALSDASRSSTAASNAPDCTSDRLQQLSIALPELNVRRGISYCADDENFYLSMLDDYVHCNKDDAMEQAFAEKDWNSYRIAVHSLKSLSRTIGLNAFAEECLALEVAAKQDDIATIEQNHATVVDHFRSITQKLSQ